MTVKSAHLVIVAAISIISSCYGSTLFEVDCSEDKLNETLARYEKLSSELYSEYANLTWSEDVKGVLEASLNDNTTGATLEEILPTNESAYLKRRPPTVCGRPARVNYHITVLSLDTIDEASMTYSLDLYLTVAWIDHRLRFRSTYRAFLILDPTWLGELWQPDTVFKNAREVTFHERIIPNHHLTMLPNKGLIYVTKLTLRLTCAMDFAFYPHDTQECDMKIESMMYTDKELLLDWDAKNPVNFMTKNKRIATPQFRLVRNKTESCTIPYFRGSFSCIRATFYLRRSLGYHLIHTYFPSGLIVVLSWVTFWIKIKDIMPRVALGVTTLLTLATLSSQSQESLPPVSYGKAIDTWMTICALFVFCSIIEFAIVNYITSRFSDDEKIPSEPEENKNPETCQAYFGPRRIYVMAHNVDKVCRLLFPVCFLISNIWYWSKHLQEDKINGEQIDDE